MNWWMLGGMAVITFWNRYAFFAKSLNYVPGPYVQRFLGYSSFAILTAIWTPILFQADYSKGSIDVAGLDYMIASALAALLSMLRVRSIIVVLLSAALFFMLRFALV